MILTHKIIDKIEYFFITNKKKLKEIYSQQDENYLVDYLKYFFNIASKIKIVDIKRLLYEKDCLGYTIIHYICSLSIRICNIDYAKTLSILFENKIKIFLKSEDDLTPYEICAGKWNKVV
jgi:hypothetical protein